MFALRNRGGSEAVEALGASFAAQSALLKHEVGCCAVLCCAVRRFGVLCCVVGVRRRLLSGTPAGACVGVPSLRGADCATPRQAWHAAALPCCSKCWPALSQRVSPPLFRWRTCWAGFRMHTPVPRPS